MHTTRKNNFYLLSRTELYHFLFFDTYFLGRSFCHVPSNRISKEEEIRLDREDRRKKDIKNRVFARIYFVPGGKVEPYYTREYWEERLQRRFCEFFTKDLRRFLDRRKRCIEAWIFARYPKEFAEYLAYRASRPPKFSLWQRFKFWWNPDILLFRRRSWRGKLEAWKWARLRRKQKKFKIKVIINNEEVQF